MTSSWPAFVFLGAMGGCIFGASGIFGQRRKHPCQTPMALLLLLTAVGMIPPFLILQSPQDFWEALDLLAPVVFSQLFVGALLAHYFTLLAPIPILDSSKSGILHAARVFRAFGSTWSLYSLPAVALLACSVYFYVLSDSASPERRLNTVAAFPPAILLMGVLYSPGHLKIAARMGISVPGVAFSFLYLLSGCVTLVLAGLLSYPSLSVAGNAGIVALLMMYGYWIQKEPALLGQGAKRALSARQRHSLEGMKRALLELMPEEKPYLDEDLDRSGLAELLNVRERDLSLLLNREMDGFTNFVNRYRIEEACKMLLDEPDRSILSITYACGFNSRSAFYQAFQKFHEMSPGDYRRLHSPANENP